jgi:3-hydroxybutyryl-CoA dehydrogenase
MSIQTVAVVGCGLMGAGIAQVVAAAGYATIVCEQEEAPLARGLARIRDGYARSVKKGSMSDIAADAAFARITATLDRTALRDADLVIEAIAEQAELKVALFRELDAICKPTAIFASNTSSIPIHQIAQATTRPDRIAGFHFFNPVPLMHLIELVSTPFTSPQTQALLRELGTTLGKTVVAVADQSGFIVNRLLIPYLFEAVRLLDAGVADRDAIDTAMKLGCGYPMGPLMLLDVIGLDTAVSIGDVLARELNDPRLAAPQRLRDMVANGQLGKKSGGGFYPLA